MNRFGRALLSGRTLVTAECLPPRGADADVMRELSASLPRELDGIVVPDNPDRVRASALSCGALLARERGRSVIMAMTSRDRNRIGLVSDALGAAALDIEAILCLGGRHQSSGIAPEAAAARDLDSIQLTQALKKMALYGSSMNGRKLEPEIKLQIGATANPYLRPLDLNLLRVRMKVHIGADFLFTHAVFDLDGFGQWLDAVRSLGLDKRTAIIASVLPLGSVERARELDRSGIYGPVGEGVIARLARSADPVREGILIAAEVAKKLKELPGIRGIHILSGGAESRAAEVMRQAGLPMVPSPAN
ncbi:MAG: methylenetetrahydrofolate reductase [Acidobacteria bacterium]|nr:methylenetetrahydrofolate reductase [Acidobacteriota bacterium]